MRLAHGGVIDFKGFNRVFVVEAVLVDTDDGLAARVNLGLLAGSSLFDTHLGQTRFNGLGHATHGFHLLDVTPSALVEVAGEALHIIGASPRINHTANVGFFLDVDLGVTGDTGTEVGGQSDGLVQGVGVQRLGVTQGGSHSFDASTRHIVERVLLGERPARGLRVCTQGQRLGALRVEGIHDLGPDHTGGAHLGNLHEMVHARAPEEGQTWRKSVDVQASLHASAEVIPTVGQGVGHLNVGGGASFLHVVARDGDAVELRHVLRGELEDVGDDAHRELRRIDIGVTHHELLQDVVLDGALQFFVLGTLLQGSDDVEGQNRQHGAVHGHGNGHFVQRNLVEQYFHVLDGADAHASLTHVAHDALVVGIVATVGGQVEGHGQTLLTSRDVTAVEGIGFLGGGETGVLTDGPRTHHVHGGVRSTEEGRDASGIVEVLHAFEVFLGVGRLHHDVFGGFPRLAIRQDEAAVLRYSVDVDVFIVRFHCLILSSLCRNVECGMRNGGKAQHRIAIFRIQHS